MPRTKRALNNKFVRFAVVIAFVTIGVFSFQNCAKFESQPLQLQTPLGSEGVKNSGLDIKIGIVRATAAGIAAGTPIEGRVLMVRDPSKGTQVFMQALGLNPALTYMSHVHNQACSIGGGAHYKIDPSVAAAIDTNEIWPTLILGADGALIGSATSPYVARAEAQSIVIHAMDNARLGCGVFYPQYGTTQKSGAFTTLPGGVAQGRTVVGSGTLIRNGWGAQTILKLAVAGLGPTATYMAHVHNAACAAAEGGVHYKQNAGVTETVATAANEIWATLVTDATGIAEARTVVNGHVATAEALSVVIHDSVTPGTRLACLDLTTDGGAMSTAIGLKRTRNIMGTASMDRLTTGQTTTTIAVTGLLPNTTYVPHVHERPCHVAGGGAHYRIDPLNQSSESNEIWLRFISDTTGRGTSTLTVNHVARPEAQSIVIHDPTDAARLACIDLY